MKKYFFEKGFLLTFILSSSLLLVFYGKLLKDVNSIFIGDSRDAMQTYYTTLYHIKYDHTYFHHDGMNYPYGENVFFTGGHIPVANVLKFINNFFPIYNSAPAILNLIMLFSVVLGALIVYLILKHFKLPAVYCAIAATGIAFLSPQIQRLGGTLSYQFAIPAFMFLLLKFNSSPSFKKSLLIGFLSFFMMSTHLYFFAFFCFMGFFYWVYFVAAHSRRMLMRHVVVHIFVQILLPYILFWTINFLTDDVKDRTGYPWGFLVALSSWKGVLFPYGKPYETIVNWFYTPSYSEWEGGHSLYRS